MNGKSKCKILKDIRRQIARDNDIAYVTSECKYQGDCTGTCPKCEAELRYLEDELRKRQKAGKAVAVAGIAAAVMVTAAGCELDDLFRPSTAGDPLEYSQTQPDTPAGTTLPDDGQSQTEPSEEVMGELVFDQTEATYEELMGDPVISE